MSDEKQEIDPTKHHYWPKILELYKSGKIPLGRMADVDVRHDLGCAIYDGGYCNCDPDVSVRP